MHAEPDAGLLQIRATSSKLSCIDFFQGVSARRLMSREMAAHAERKAIVKITVETSVAAPIDIVWKTYTTPDDIKKWNAASDDWHTTAAAVDLREGGEFSSRMEAKDGSMGFDFAGTYTKIVPHKLIEYAFGDRTARVEFTPGPKGIAVRVTFDAETQNPIEQQRDGWQAILNNFARYVESKKSA